PTRTGEYDLKFFSPAGDMIAQTVVEVVDKETHTFTSLYSPHIPDAKPGEVDSYIPRRLAVPQAIPGVFDAAAKDLPRISALPVDKATKISVSNGAVTIESTPRFFIGIERTLLARFYVNGKPATINPPKTDIALGTFGQGSYGTAQTIN